jgi:hypothetical protein
MASPRQGRQSEYRVTSTVVDTDRAGSRQNILPTPNNINDPTRHFPLSPRPNLIIRTNRPYDDFLPDCRTGEYSRTAYVVV